MPETGKNQVPTADVDLDTIDQDEQPAPTQHSRQNTVIWVVVIVLLILAFACFGVYTLLHVPPQPDNTMIQQTIAFILAH
ncbi:MAG TPA: hypothetical protein VHZ51_11140 [Ktedonobacteraceae bacterium]|nr:hypothetical protein [Ktedonobacteraceae bacterium]